MIGPAAIFYGMTVVVLAGVSLHFRQRVALAWCAYQGASWMIFNFAKTHFSAVAGVDGVSLIDCIGAAISGVIAITLNFEGRAKPWHWVMFGAFTAQVITHVVLMAIDTYGTVTPVTEWVYRFTLNRGWDVQQLTILWVAVNETRRRPRYSRPT